MPGMGCRTGGRQDRLEAGQVEGRTGWRQDRWDAGKAGLRKGGIRYWRDSGLEVYRK